MGCAIAFGTSQSNEPPQPPAAANCDAHFAHWCCFKPYCYDFIAFIAPQFLMAEFGKKQAVRHYLVDQNLCYSKDKSQQLASVDPSNASQCNRSRSLICFRHYLTSAHLPPVSEESCLKSL